MPGKAAITCTVPYLTPNVVVYEGSGNDVLSTTEAGYLGAVVRPGTPITSIKICGGISKIDVSAFKDWSHIKNIDFSEAKDLRTIGANAFDGCDVSEVSIPSNVTMIDNGAFLNNKNLETMTFESGTDELHLGQSIIYSSFTDLYCGRTIALNTSDHLAFAYSGLRSVHFFGDIAAIRSDVFKEAKVLSTVDFAQAEKLTTIFPNAFLNCESITELHLPSSLTTISTSAFQGCWHLTNLDLSNSKNISTIGASAFAGCSNLASTTIWGTPTINDTAFPEATILVRMADVDYDEWLKSYKVADIVTELYIPGDKVASYAFTETDNLAKKYRNVKKVVFGPQVTTIGANILRGAYKLEDIEFQSNVKIGTHAFLYANALKNINEEKIKEVGDYSFNDCYALKSLDLTNCEKLGQFAFMGCKGLTEVKVYEPLTVTRGRVFANCPLLKTLYIDSPELLKKTNYTATTSLTAGLGNTFETIIVGDAVTTIGANAFAGLTTLKNVTLGSNVSTIADTSFPSGVTSLTINSNTLINKSFEEQFPFIDAFASLKELTLGENVTEVGDNAFNADLTYQNHWCPLEKVTFLADNVAIGKNAFYSCRNLATIEGNVKSVKALSFANTAISAITIIEDKCIEDGAFSGCEKLSTVHLPEYVESIGEDAFKDCTSMKTFTCETITPPAVDATTFANVPTKTAVELIVHHSCLDDYKEANVWKDFFDYFVIEGIKLMDGEPYTQSDRTDGYDIIRYTRDFKNTNWQALYIPFSMKYEDWCDNFEVARLNDVHQYDDNDDGEIERTTLEYIKVKSGSIQANRPYIIKSKTTGVKTIEVENTMLMAAESNRIDCSSVETLYTFVGIYEQIIIEPYTYYAFAGGNLGYTTSVQPLGAYRWYLDVTDRNTESPVSLALIRVSVEGEEETSLESIYDNNQQILVHSLDGKLVKILSSTEEFYKSELPSGIYIINGKKIHKL